MASVGNGATKTRRVIRSDDLPNLPADVSAVEVWSTGLRVLQALLPKRMSADVRIKLFDVGSKWLSSKPTEMPADKKKGSQELQNLLAMVKGEDQAAMGPGE